SSIHCAAPHRDLHSFPTRRSSDLVANSYTGQTTVNGGTLNLNKSASTTSVPGNLVVGSNSQARAQSGLRGDYYSWAGVSGGIGRSEEHTSELQSRVDLVCRLLLEK